MPRQKRAQVVGADSKLTQRDDLEPVGGPGIAAAKGGSVKSRRLGQICVGANNLIPGARVDKHTGLARPVPCRCCPLERWVRRQRAQLLVLPVESPSLAWPCANSLGIVQRLLHE